MGDSHTAVFNEEGMKKFLRKNYDSFVETVGGATISGLTNPNSKTNANAIFNSTHNLIKPDVLITQIGEVDTGFVIWYRAQKYRASVSEMLNQCIDNYRALLTQYQGKEKTIVISAPLPTIQDNQDWGEVANARKEIKATIAERTALTIEFNTSIEKMTKELGLNFINLDIESAGNDGLVAKFLLNTNMSDHHYCRKAYARLIKKHLETIL
jgi:hypothetical protein